MNIICLNQLAVSYYYICILKSLFTLSANSAIEKGEKDLDYEIYIF